MLKNKILLAFLLLSTVFVACEKKLPFDGEQQLKIDQGIIDKYLLTNKKSMTKDASGIYYEVLATGEGNVPQLTDNIIVGFTGALLNTTNTFQSVSLDRPDTLLLGNTIPGWKFGIPKIKPGGQIRLIVPSSLAYKDFSSSNIPAYSILDFTITLVGINKNNK